MNAGGVLGSTDFTDGTDSCRVVDPQISQMARIRAGLWVHRFHRWHGFVQGCGSTDSLSGGPDAGVRQVAGFRKHRSIESIMKRTSLGMAWMALAFFACAELLLAMPVAWWLYVLLIPMFAFGLHENGEVPGQRGSWKHFGVAMVLVAALHFVPWTSRKPFLRDLHRVQAGMTESEVRLIMGRYAEGTGWPAMPEGGSGTLTDLGSGGTHRTKVSTNGDLALRDALVFRHSTDGRFNSDWGIVKLDEGRVTGVSFSPD
jgi:hypothetical protein